jgi:isoquinoline 1-oxidoreductase beta subunit
VVSAKRITADFSAPLLAHAAMEPVNATAQFANGRLKLWVPTQTPWLAVKVAARVADIDEDNVELTVTLLGGGFGRRLDNDMVAQVVQIARAMEGTPIQLLWTREQDLAHDFYRPAAVARLTGMLSDEGELIGWDTKSASGAPGQHLLHRAFGLPMTGPDKTTIEGLYDHCYEIPNQLASHVIVESAVPLGTWRSVGHSHNAFFKESFIDELAHAAGVDPVRFRRQTLYKHPRHLTVLDAVVKLAGKPAAGHAQGVALHQSFGSIVAQVAEVSVEATQIRVHKVSCVVDCGVVVNPEGVRQQMESAIAFGLSAALHDEITINEGRVQQSNFHDYPTLRITDMPEVQVEIIAGAEAPEGVGEPGTPPIAPAVANAVFKLTGKRLRSLPLRLEEVPSS